MFNNHLVNFPSALRSPYTPTPAHHRQGRLFPFLPSSVEQASRRPAPQAAIKARKGCRCDWACSEEGRMETGKELGPEAPAQLRVAAQSSPCTCLLGKSHTLLVLKPATPMLVALLTTTVLHHTTFYR